MYSFWAPQRAQPSSFRGSGWLEPQLFAGFVVLVHDQADDDLDLRAMILNHGKSLGIHIRGTAAAETAKGW